MSAAEPSLDRGTLLALVAMSLGVFLVANDFTALSVALPAIEREFDSGVSTVQWVINGYALVFGVLIVTGGRLADTYGRRRMFAGILLLSLVGEDAAYAAAVPGMVVLGVGFGLFVSTVTTAAVTALSETRASLGGAILYMFQVAGGSIGLALTTTIFARASRAQLSSDLAALGARASEEDVRDVHGILAGTDSARRVAGELPAQAAAIEQLVRDAFAHGMSVAFRVDAALAFAGLVVAVLFVGGTVRLRHRAIDDTAGASR